MGPGDLKQTICGLVPNDEKILVGFDTSEDASVYQINETQAIVQTLDFITPVVDDPYIYGQIAAANALSDVFAMGADVKTAMNIVGFDKKNLSKEALGLILNGGNEKIKECGGVLLGGHTIESPEMYYGLSVTG
jgi:selenide, water dikinase